MKLRSQAASITFAVALSAGVAITGMTAAGQAPAPAGQAPAGGRGAGGRGGGVAPALFTLTDINKDGAVTRGELMATLEKWYADTDTAKSGSITSEQLAATLNAAFPAPAPGAGRGAGPACGGNSPTKTPCPDHVTAMTAALPAKAPAKAARPRKILVLGNAQGFVHSSIPLAGATVEAMGNKLKTWTTTITYNPADINTENLKQYDAVFLASTTGCFLDAVPGQPVPSKAEIDARRAALLAFVRGGKGLAGIHAATDSYHGTCPTDQPADGARGGRGGGRGAGATPGGQLTTQVVTAADKNTDQQLTLVELDTMANAWFDVMDTDKSGRIAQADFAARFALLTPAPAGGGRGGRGGGADAPPVARGSVRQPATGSWPEFNKLIGGYFKYHWNDGTRIPVKIDDPKSPINKAFAGQGFEIIDETYTFAQDSFSRENVHVLKSVDYDKMPPETKAMEPAGTARTDGDYALSYIRREGQGRVFYEANGHNERIYAMPNMLEHILAGIQYALGDLKADDSPSRKPATAKK